MMARDWQPGDVAMVRYKLMGEWREDARVRAEHPPLGGGVWWGPNGWIGDSTAKEARPLVVIDPEDREAAKRLLETYGRQFTAWTPELDSNVTRLQAALREFANPTPPKPAEPTGIGAVVEAVYDNRFVRIDRGNKAWRRVGDIDPSATCSWEDIDAVRVLSEGVTS